MDTTCFQALSTLFSKNFVPRLLVLYCHNYGSGFSILHDLSEKHKQTFLYLFTFVNFKYIGNYSEPTVPEGSIFYCLFHENAYPPVAFLSFLLTFI